VAEHKKEEGLRDYHILRLKLKMQSIKEYVEGELDKEKDRRKGKDVDYNFAKLIEKRKKDFSMRLKSNWSYDILRSPDFAHAQKIKKRIQ